MDLRTAHALVRFGLGASGAEPPPSDPSAWLLDQLRQPDSPGIGPTPSTAEGLAAIRADREARKAGELAARSIPGPRAVSGPGAGGDRPRGRHPTPFRERLVWFWTNHFTVSLRRGQCAAVAGAFVQEAIRPHVTGKFQDMLLAVMRHPAMLIYLDNAGSVGPDSLGGQLSHRGLNENLARECMELHTVSPASGYTQADVTAFARILTGWSIELNNDPSGLPVPPAHPRAGRADPDGPQLPRRRGRVASRRCGSSPIIPRRIGSWPPNWCAISSPTRRRRPRFAASRASCAIPAAISARRRRVSFG